MDSQGIVDYMKQAMTIPIKREKKDHSGATSLIFAGTMFSLLGCNYLFKSSFFNTTEYLSLKEALQKMDRSSEDMEIPVHVEGKVLKVVSGDERCVINKTHVELRSNYFDSDSGKWKEHNHILKESINGNDFIVVTPSGQCLTVLLPPILSSSHLYLPYLVHTQKRALSKEEKEEYSDEIAKQHLSDESSIDMEVIRTEEQLLVNHRLYLRGILSRKNGLLTLSYNKDCKLVISAKEINSLNNQNRINGILCTVAGIGLLVGGFYRYSNYDCLFKK